MFAERRERLLSAMGAGVLVVPAAPVAIRNNDVEHAYRQDSDFFYLTGFDEPESVLILTNQHPEHQTVLFVRTRNPEREIWDGPRAGVDGAVSKFGADAAFPIDELASRLPDYLADVDRVHYRLGRDRSFDDRFFAALDVVRRRARLGTRVPTEVVDPAATLHELRLVKGDEEVESMKRAAAVTRDAHLAAMRAARPGIHEFEVEAEMNRIFRKAGCERPAYDSILGSGRNATILHYRKNDRLMEDGDLLLIDAGCELDYYASDVTRTFPVNGKYSEAQRAIYDLVLDSQRAAIALCVPGKTLDDIHQVATRVIAAGLVELGLLEGDVDTLISDGTHKAYYMHRTSHWLGMDVHDVGAYFVDGVPRPLVPGHVLTVEPGIYIADDADCDPRWRGIGIRIEDDILVTEGAPLNLTAEIPKAPDEVEAILRESR
ncbi:MAG: Xaa-Pro aminopeptidase [Deltaproteobacteria bacterium]|nr:MAG: Xaa-Pro aminopeptidase [Deltaproteobacteria bacterium]